MKLSKIIKAIKSNNLELDCNETSNVIVCCMERNEETSETGDITGTISGRCNDLASMLYHMTKQNEFFKDVLLDVVETIKNEAEEE